jgi:pilus assembly protein CpaC
VFRSLRVLALASLALLVSSGMLQDKANAFEVVTPQSERSIGLVVGTGQLIRVERDFTSLFVADPAVADVQVKSPRLLYLTGVGVGETTLFAVDDEDAVLMSSTIRVTHNTGALQQQLGRVAPGQGLQATSVDRSLVLSGTVATPEQAADAVLVASQFVDDPAQVVNRLEVAAPTQVNLQVRIAEVSRSVNRQFGLEWDVAYAGSRTSAAAVANGVNAVTTAVPGFNFNVVLRALADEGLVSILAEPNLTARSGEAASFLAGGEFPYLVPTETGQPAVEFRNFGVGLTFTPTVLNGNRISLRVGTEVSELGAAPSNQPPPINVRRAETTVDLGSGQSFAIAGLMQNTSSTNHSKVPGLGSLPVIGPLFRSSNFQRGQTELVIVVTPVIVQPTTGAKLRLPTDTYVPPNDFERIIMGRVQGDVARAQQVQQTLGQRRLHGASGFVFE